MGSASYFSTCEWRVVAGRYLVEVMPELPAMGTLEIATNIAALSQLVPTGWPREDPAECYWNRHRVYAVKF